MDGTLLVSLAFGEVVWYSFHLECFDNWTFAYKYSCTRFGNIGGLKASNLIHVYNDEIRVSLIFNYEYDHVVLKNDHANSYYDQLL